MRHTTGCKTLSVILAAVLIVPGCAARARPRDQGVVGTIRVAGKNAWVDNTPARTGTEIRSGQTVRTGADTGVIIDLVDGGQVQLDENTDPSFWMWVEMNVCIIRMFIGYGQVAGSTPAKGGCKWEVTTDSLRSIAQTQFNLEAGPGHALLTVVEGQMVIESPQQLSVTTGRQMQVAGTRVVSVRALSADEVHAVSQWKTKYVFPKSAGVSWGTVAIAAGAAAVIGGIIAAIFATKDHDDHRKPKTPTAPPDSSSPSHVTHRPHGVMPAPGKGTPTPKIE